MATKTVDSVFKFIEGICYFALAGISILFIIGVLNQFLQKKTGFHQYEEPLTKSPTISFCFLKTESQKSFIFEEHDFNVSFGTYGMILNEKFWHYEVGVNWVDLKLGSNLFQKQTQVDFKKIRTRYLGECYQISTELVPSSEWAYVKLKFNNSILEEDIPRVKIFFTSEENAYGIKENLWEDGKSLSYILEPKASIWFQLDEDKYGYIKWNITSCRQENYYQRYAGKIEFANYTTCPKKCLSVSLLSMDLPLCQTKEEFKCADIKERLIWWNLKESECPKPCSVTEFIEHGKTEDFKNVKNHEITFYYKFLKKATINVNQEYLIIDALGMIGSVGGTLGLFIEFSFIGIITSTLTFLKTLKQKCTSHR